MNALEQSQQVLENEKVELSKEKENLAREKTELIEKNKTLTTEKENLTKANTELKTEKENLAREKTDLTDKNKALTTEKENLTKANTELTNKNTELTNKITGLSKEKDELTDKNKNLTTEKDNLNTDLSNAKSQVIQVNQEKDKLEQKHAPYQKLEKLYEVFLEVKGCLSFEFVATTHSAMDLIAYVFSNSKYYLESLYNKASQELSDKKSDKGEKLAELFDLLFEYIKDKKFERLKEPSAYDSTCKSLYPEQNTSQKMQRVVLIGYTYDKKTPPYYTIVDMGS
ncbi:hypothetical protein KVE88_00395 [Helicobacter pylori]|nr:hypothetical protein KVE88_00395 [Helicobacter pylori]